jgi:hypothetical protein
MGMYQELASVRQVVDMSPQETLDSAQAFLVQQGYRTVQRTEAHLTVERRPTDKADDQDALVLAVAATPELEGGVHITVKGNDHKGVQERQEQWLEWSESLPKKEPGQRPPEHADLGDTLPDSIPHAEVATVPTTPEERLEQPETLPTVRETIFDRPDQLEKIRAGLLPGEDLEAVLDVKGGGTGFVGITSKRVIFQDSAWVTNAKAVVSIPYSRIHTVAAEDQVGLFTGRGFFSSSKIIITTSDGPKAFQFRGADKAHLAHDLILKRLI